MKVPFLLLCATILMLLGLIGLQKQEINELRKEFERMKKQVLYRQEAQMLLEWRLEKQK